VTDEKPTVVVGISGGVDSSVAAYLLKEKGFNVIGLFMINWNSEDGECTAIDDYEDVKRVCNIIGIPYYSVNYAKEYYENVFEYFLDEYKKGRTPNPDVLCNREIKFGPFLNYAKKIGADFIATGHYAAIAEINNRLTIRSVDNSKDQSYALYNLTQQQLARTLFPLSDINKEEVRSIAAKEIGIRVAYKPDSQEICFIPNNKHSEFLTKYFNKDLASGNFIDVSGNILGRHLGIGHYTIGQRKGLGMAFGEPKYVVKINAESGNIVLGNNADLYSKELIANDCNFMSLNDNDNNIKEIRCRGKIRYSHKSALCRFMIVDNKISAVFDEAQRAITPGQAAVFYDDYGHIICGGTII